MHCDIQLLEKEENPIKEQIKYGQTRMPISFPLFSVSYW